MYIVSYIVDQNLSLNFHCNPLIFTSYDGAQKWCGFLQNAFECYVLPPLHSHDSPYHIYILFAHYHPVLTLSSPLPMFHRITHSHPSPPTSQMCIFHDTYLYIRLCITHPLVSLRCQLIDHLDLPYPVLIS